jgi:hypothetical protein
LFSSADVASYINNTFEPVWESVRPVPIVTIDFGNGYTITRTLHGNIATYLCNAQGTVFDILPGIYEPAEYLNQLNQFALLYRHAHQQFVGNPNLKDRDELRQALAAHADGRLKAYHERQAQRLKDGQQADVLVRSLDGGGGKRLIERPIELIAAGQVAKTAAGGAKANAPPAPPVPTKPEDIAGWKELAEDTKINESVRRRAIHEKLAASGPVKPEDIKKWLFKEVLAADLDDPTLGIGDILNKRYPFAEEDTAAKAKRK